MMTRIRSFAAPHKGLRNVIGQFAFRLGHTSFSDPQQLTALKRSGQDMFTLLNDHVHTENEHTLRRLEERAKGASEHDLEDHERLESIQDALQQQLEKFSGHESPDEIHAFYLDFSMFQSQYLAHIFEEETVTELLLQQHFTDEELIQQRIAIMKNLQFPTLLLWLRYIVPAQSETDSLGMLSGLKASAPKAAFDAVLETIKQEMTPSRYESLVSKLI